MLLIIIFTAMIVLGFVFIYVNDHYYAKEGLAFVGGVLVAIDSVLLILSAIGIIVSHAYADNVVEKNKIEYEGLCKRYEIINSEYEDVSKSDVIADITEWNMKVYNTKYWTENPWTNWFNPKKISDNLEYISLESESEE